MKATLTVNTGAMFSGKSTLLISQGEKHMRAGQNVLYIKPSMDTRYSEDEIVTHSNLRVRAVAVDTTKPLELDMEDYEVILIDEAQFFDRVLLQSINELLKAGKTIYVSCLDMDFKGQGFDTAMNIMAIADKVNKLKAICEDCGEDAVISGKRIQNDDVVELGAKDLYVPLCRKCYFDFMK
jgi:thymidine kinase